MIEIGRRALKRAVRVFFVCGVALALVLSAAVGPRAAWADDAPAAAAGAAADTTNAGAAKAEGADKGGADKAKAEKAEKSKEKKAEKSKNVSKNIKVKAKAESKEKAKDEKGGSVSETKAAGGTMPVKPAVEPAHVTVQHILIGFAGSIPGKGITRTKEEAKTLAYEILDRARKGEDFDLLVKQYTDDSPPGIYSMSGFSVPPGAGEYARDGMVPAFGSVGFAISVGNIGIADYDPASSPYGFHIIKRLK